MQPILEQCWNAQLEVGLRAFWNVFEEMWVKMNSVWYFCLPILYSTMTNLYSNWRIPHCLNFFQSSLTHISHFFKMTHSVVFLFHSDWWLEAFPFDHFLFLIKSRQFVIIHGWFNAFFRVESKLISFLWPLVKSVIMKLKANCFSHLEKTAVLILWIFRIWALFLWENPHFNFAADDLLQIAATNRLKFEFVAVSVLPVLDKSIAKKCSQQTVCACALNTRSDDQKAAPPLQLEVTRQINVCTLSVLVCVTLPFAQSTYKYCVWCVCFVLQGSVLLLRLGQNGSARNSLH